MGCHVQRLAESLLAGRGNADKDSITLLYMKFAHSFGFLIASATALGLAGCAKMQITHVPPGQSARAAIDSRNSPTPSPSGLPTDANAPTLAAAGAPNPALPGAETLPPLPVGSASVPTNSKTADHVADAYTRGSFAMQAGQSAEATKAFEEVVKLDPEFTDAWGKLALLYQKNGDSLKATEAFKKAKRLGDANGGTVTRDAAGGLQLP